MRKVIYSLCIVFSLCLILYSLNYICNERMISKMEDNIFDNNDFAWLGFMEPWIEPYNMGNSYFKQKKYDKAIEEYDKALKESFLPEKKECDIRVNKALSMVIPIDTENVNDENRLEIIDILDDALDVLSEEGCATNDGHGHDKDAQTLYDEILAYKEELEQQQEQSDQQQQQGGSQDDQNEGGGNGEGDQDQNSGDNNNNDPDQNNDQQNQQGQDPDNKENPEQQAGNDEGQDQQQAQQQKDQQLKDALEGIQDQANKERAEELAGDDDDSWFYSGDIW